MSRYPPRIIIQNPEKRVPDNIVEQFFLTIRTGDIEKIKQLVNQYKNKYNLIERSAKGSPTESGKTPFHVVLELDDKIANNATKLEILKFLDGMGAPMDLPDSADVWPIHLAAALQSPEIVNFLIKKNVSLNRKDSSNNTPLHYSIIGREIACPSRPSIGSLSPPQRPEKKSLNESLENINNELSVLLQQNPLLNDNLIHIINTIMRIPQMYAEDRMYRDLETEVITIFSETALSPGYQGGLTAQQKSLEQLVERTYTTINDELLRGLTSPLSIAPNNGGWGPRITTAGATRAPTNVERILSDDRTVLFNEIETEYLRNRATITSVTTTMTDATVRTTIPAIIDVINNQYINRLVFCTECPTISFGEEVALTKMLYLLIWNYNKTNYVSVLTKKMMDYQLMNLDSGLFGQIILNGGLAINPDNILMQNTITSLLTRNPNQLNQSLIDGIASIRLADRGSMDRCIQYNLNAIIFEETPGDPPSNPIDTDQVLREQMSRIFTTTGYEKFREDFDKLPNVYRDRLKWREMLTLFLHQSLGTMVTQFGTTDAVWNRIEDLFDYREGEYREFITPRPSGLAATPALAGGMTWNDYTFLDAVRVMSILAQYMTENDFQVNKFPEIFGEPINGWMEYIDSLSDTMLVDGTATIGARFPEFIFLFRLLMTRILLRIDKIIRDCLNRTIQMIRPLLPRTITNIIINNIDNPLDDSFILNMLLPPGLENTDFADKVINRFSALLSNKWTSDNSLAKWFYSYKKNIPDEFLNQLGDLMLSPENIGYFLNNDYNAIRNLIETNVASSDIYVNVIRPIITRNKFRNSIRTYLGTFKQADPTKPVLFPIDSIRILPKFTTSIDLFNLADIYAQYLAKLRAGAINSLFFLTEVYERLFFDIQKMFRIVQVDLSTVNQIIGDIIAYINARSYYYIPQIFLPALIKAIIIPVDFMMQINNILEQFRIYRAEFYDRINAVDAQYNVIIDLGEQFMEYVGNQIKIIYGTVADVIKYHNNVVDFLNYHSAHQLVSRSPSKIQLFTMNLVPLETLPDIFTPTTNFESLLRILRLYRIPEMIYFAENTEVNRMNFDMFNRTGTPAIGERYRIRDYRDIIQMRRAGVVSNSPEPNDNLQINIIARRTATADPEYELMEIPGAIAGEWLNVNARRSGQLTYLNAFIAYLKTSLLFYAPGTPFVSNINTGKQDWLDGMIPSIRRLAAPHLKMTKQRIVEEVVQYVIDNKDLDIKDPASTKIIFQKARALGNETTYTDVSDVKVYVVIAKLVDATLNTIIERAIRQSIDTWITNFASNNFSYNKLVNEINETVSMVKNPEYLKISLQDIDQEIVDKLLTADISFADFRVTQIEPDILNIQYVTKPTPSQFVHYLYSINYFSSTNVTTNKIGTNKKCYKINPDITRKLITPDTINSRNSDLNTPLHMAVEIYHPELVELLLSHGAKPKSFSNLHNKTPYDMALDTMLNHISYADGATVMDSIKNFVTPFNDLLIARLGDEKFANNIVRDVTMAIPIQLIIYNHMFNLYLQNYRYNFTFELKTAIKNMYQTYFGLEDTLYPVDIFEINDQDLPKVLETDILENRTIRNINEANSKRVSDLEKQLELLNNQINGLIKERDTDPEQIVFIDRILAVLETSRAKISDKLSRLQQPIQEGPRLDPGLIASYKASYNSIIRKIRDRNITITDFYNTSFMNFGRTDKNKQLHLSIWRNYFGKNLIDAPSMIFPLTTKIIGNLIERRNFQQFNPPLKEQMNNVVEFYRIVKDYINLKESLPLNLDDNPPLEEEFKQTVYLINLILTPAIRNIILEQFYTGLAAMEGNDIIVRNQNDIMQEILDIEFNGLTIDTYMYEYLPKIATKYYTTVYNSTNDVARSITNANDLFLPIIQIIKANKRILINDDSVIIQNFRDYLIPFMANTYQNFINSTKLAIYGYERYLINTYERAKILQLLI